MEIRRSVVKGQVILNRDKKIQRVYAENLSTNPPRTGIDPSKSGFQRLGDTLIQWGSLLEDFRGEILFPIPFDTTPQVRVQGVGHIQRVSTVGFRIPEMPAGTTWFAVA